MRMQPRSKALENQLAAQWMVEWEKASVFIIHPWDLMAGFGSMKFRIDLSWKCAWSLPPNFDGLFTSLTSQVRPLHLPLISFLHYLKRKS